MITYGEVLLTIKDFSTGRKISKKLLNSIIQAIGEIDNCKDIEIYEFTIGENSFVAGFKTTGYTKLFEELPLKFSNLLFIGKVYPLGEVVGDSSYRIYAHNGKVALLYPELIYPKFNKKVLL